MLTKIVSECGFSENEAQILSFLLTRGSQRAGVIAQRLGIKRPTVYATLEDLVNQGVVTKRRTGAAWIRVQRDA